MFRPRHILFPDSFPSLASFFKEIGLSCFRGSNGCSGRKSVWMTNKAALYTLSIQCLASTVMVMISLNNPSIDASVDMISTARGSAFVGWIVDCCLSSCCSKDLCGGFRSSVYQDLSRSRSFPRYISASLAVVYSSGTCVVPTGNIRQRKASPSTIYMQVDTVVESVCIRRYDVPRSVFQIRIRFVGHLLCISEIVCSILSRHKP